jgi:hypothetical protein
MVKIQKLILKALTNSFIISAVSLLVAFVSKEGSMTHNVSGGLGFYGSIITVNLCVVHVIAFLLSKIIRSK